MRLKVFLNFEVYGDRVVADSNTWVMLLMGASALVGYRRMRRGYRQGGKASYTRAGD